MTDQFVLDLTRQALMVALQLAAPFLIAALIIGLIVGLIQSLTQIQEQTLAFVPKLVIIGLIFVLSLPWMLQTIVGYTRGILIGLADMPR
ncbi:MAG: flagellar biosynthesis protein FliQ [Gemmatimonadetes bacterium]|jgi:flagellar biosynthetic protein FliQ|nr:flagellar biosynthesis protein FliQ [Gemmatimonadota bacterium]